MWSCDVMLAWLYIYMERGPSNMYKQQSWCTKYGLLSCSVKKIFYLVLVQTAGVLLAAITCTLTWNIATVLVDQVTAVSRAAKVILTLRTMTITTELHTCRDTIICLTVPLFKLTTTPLMVLLCHSFHCSYTAAFKAVHPLPTKARESKAGSVITHGLTLSLSLAAATVEVIFHQSSTGWHSTWITVLSGTSTFICVAITQVLVSCCWCWGVIVTVVAACIMVHLSAPGKVVGCTECWIMASWCVICPVLAPTLIELNLVVTAHTSCVGSFGTTAELLSTFNWLTPVVLVWSYHPAYYPPSLSTGSACAKSFLILAVCYGLVHEVAFEACPFGWVTALAVWQHPFENKMLQVWPRFQQGQDDPHYYSRTPQS